MSVPTQFMQVQAKYVETLANLDNGLTVADKLKILGGQLALYGAAGVPISGNRLSNWLSAATGWSEEELAENEFVRDSINGGFVQAIAHNVLGLEGEFATRGAILNNTDTLLGDIFLGEAAPYELFAGPSVVWPERIMQDSQQLWDFVTAAKGAGNISSTEVFWSAMQNLIEVTSTGDNAMKAWMMYRTGKISSKYQEYIDDAELGDIVAQGLGFSSSDMAEFYSTKKLIRAKQKAQQRVIQKITNVMNDQITNPTRDTQEIFETISFMVDNVTDNEVEKAELSRKLWEKYNNPKNAKEKVIKEWLEEKKNSFAGAWYDALGTKPISPTFVEE